MGEKNERKRNETNVMICVVIKFAAVSLFFSCDSNIDVIKINEMAAKISIDAKKNVIHCCWSSGCKFNIQNRRNVNDNFPILTCLSVLIAHYSV